jgi:DNA-binding CsgD family transcriptional regulator
MQTFTTPEFTARNVNNQLTPGELETLAWMAEGKDNAVIGMLRGHGESGAAKFVTQILRKLDSHSRCHAVARAFARGLLVSKEATENLAKAPRHLLAIALLFSGSFFAALDSTEDLCRLSRRMPRTSKTTRVAGRSLELTLDTLLQQGHA